MGNCLGEHSRSDMPKTSENPKSKSESRQQTETIQTYPSIEDILREIENNKVYQDGGRREWS